MTAEAEPDNAPAPSDPFDPASISDAERADLVERLAELKSYKYLLTTTGEQMSPHEHDREHDTAAGILKAWILAQGPNDRGQYDPIEIEGLPALELTIPMSDDVDAAALFAEDAELLFELLEHGCMKVDTKAAARVLNPDMAARLKRWIHRIGGTPRLAFRRER